MKNGLLVDIEGTKRYYMNDKRHRVDGPAIEYANGEKFWFLNGKRHREDGPAIGWPDGSNFWWFHNERHRIDGPAVEYANGDKSWWLHGKQLFCPVEFKTMEDFFARLNTDEEYSLQYINDINGLIEMINNPTAKQKRLHAMKWKL